MAAQMTTQIYCDCGSCSGERYVALWVCVRAGDLWLGRSEEYPFYMIQKERVGDWRERWVSEEHPTEQTADSRPIREHRERRRGSLHPRGKQAAMWLEIKRQRPQHIQNSEPVPRAEATTASCCFSLSAVRTHPRGTVVEGGRRRS